MSNRNGCLLYVTKVFFALVCIFRVSSACELCGITSETLREQLNNSDVAVVVQRQSVQPPSAELPSGSLTVIARHVLKGGQAPNVIEAGKSFTLDQFREGASQELYLLFGGIDPESKKLIWGFPQDLSKSALNYLQHLPPEDAPAMDRLKFYLKYLEHEDNLVGNDAWDEVAGAEYEDLKAARELLPVSDLRRWLKSPDTLITRTGLYALLLGIAGHQEDAPQLETFVFSDSEDQLTGMMAKMGGYLLLSRDAGFRKIHEQIILNSKASREKLFAALSVYRFLWTYEKPALPQDQIKQSMHYLLRNPELGALVIVDLARWQDWSAIDNVVALFTEPDFSDRSSRHAIIRYLVAASRDLPEATSPADPLPAHVIKAREHLARLTAEYPTVVESAKRFGFD